MPTTAEQCPNYEINQQQCPCPNEDCEKQGICCECIAAHREAGNRTMCMRETPRPAETKDLPIGASPDCINRARNEEFCPCAETSCARHSLCCDCVRFHWGHNQWPKVACV